MEQVSDSEASKVEHNSDLPNDNRGKGVGVLSLASSSPANEFDPGWRFYTSFTSLCIVTLAVALDATSLSVAFPIIIHP